MCVHVHVYVCGCTYMWKPEVDVGCLLIFNSYLFDVISISFVIINTEV